MSPVIIKQNRRVLVIDDNSAIHDDFSKILGAPEADDLELDELDAKLFGARESVLFEIDSALQGVEGLSKVGQALSERRPYALAFVDVRMPPGWDGIETARRLWQVDPDLQIVFCTAYSDYSWDEMQDHLAPGDRLLILKKPFEAIEVQQLANALAEKWRLTKQAQMTVESFDRLVRERTRQLEESQEKLREQASLLDKARDAIFVCDMGERITYWNRSAEVLFGYASREVEGSDAGQLLKLEPAPYARARATVLEAGEWVGELRQVSKAGRELLVESRWTLVRDAAGDPKAIMVMNTDVTERRKLEAHLYRAQRMESIGTLAGGIAHDLNNVLQPILMSIDLLKAPLPAEDKDNILASMERSAQRGADLVRQVLSYARGMDGMREDLDAVSVVREIEQFVEETFPKNIRFTAEPAAGLPSFRGDRTQLHQVLLNLCVNARDAMPDGGSLTLAARCVPLNECDPGAQAEPKAESYIVFEVADSGAGIPASVLEKIYDPFFTTKPFGKGTGLGLSTAMSIVKAHGGFMTVHSEVNRGTCFHACFPAGNAAMPATQHAVIGAPRVGLEAVAARG